MPDHYVVIWKPMYHQVLRFQRFDTDELAQERFEELLDNRFVKFAYVQTMTEREYADFLHMQGLWENN